MRLTRFVPKRITRGVGSQVLTVKQNSPHLFFGVGLAGVAAGTVLACRATLKAEPVLDEFRDDISAVKRDLREPSEEYKKELAYTYFRGSLALGKLYAPAIVVSSVGVACLTGSHVQLTRRNTALTVAYAGLHQAFEDYRERVRNELGNNEERDLFFGAQKKKVKRDGETIEVTEYDPNLPSPYARYFDRLSNHWVRDAEYNHAFVSAQQHYFNQRLQIRGYLYLNEVYHALGIPETKAGQVVGWRLNGKGDGYVDFRMYTPANAHFATGNNEAILLDFNVDGVIWHDHDKDE